MTAHQDTRSRGRFCIVVWIVLVLVSSVSNTVQASGGACRSDVQKQVSATAAFSRCSAATGLRLDKKLKKKDDNDPSRSAFCGSSACFQVFMQLRSLGALVCLEEYGTSTMPLWLEATGPSCFGSAAFETPASVEVATSPPQTPTPSESIPVDETSAPPAAPVDEDDPVSQTGSASASIPVPETALSSSSLADDTDVSSQSSSSNGTSNSTNVGNSTGINNVSRTSDSAPTAPERGRSTSSVLVWMLIITGTMVVLLVAAACFVKRRRQLLKEGPDYIKGANTARGCRAESRTVELSLNGPSCLPTTTTRIDETTEEILHSYRIPTEKLLVGTLLSRGGYGEVYEGTYRDQAVAIKTLLPDQRRNTHQIQNFLQEIKLLASLEHERIVQFIGVSWDTLNDLSVVMEFMEGGDLRTLLQEYEADTQKTCGFDAQKTKIALQVAHGLVYLHSLEPSIVHRDLKSRNILLDAELNAKLTDFGVSREMGDGTMTAAIGTSLWMAPEVMLGERYDERADIFSFGVVLSELDRHVLPYSHAVRESNANHQLPQTTIMQMVSTGRLTVLFTSPMHSAVAQLGRECVALDPAERPRASELLYRLHQINESFQREKGCTL